MDRKSGRVDGYNGLYEKLTDLNEIAIIPNKRI